MKLFALAALSLALALTAGTAVAGAEVPADVSRIHAAVTELAAAKRAAADEVARAKGAAGRRIARCQSSGPGWRRIRGIGDPSQRSAYLRGARELWADLRDAALEQAALEVHDPAFKRFLARLEAPFSDPVLQAGADALRGRIAYDRAAYAFASCRTFESLLRRVREYRIGGEHGVEGDYRAGRTHNTFVGYVAKRQRREDAANGGSGARARLDAARARIVALGGDPGYASYFAFAH